MAEKIVSPGVFTRENDLSFISQGVGQIGAAIIGPFQKGPAFVPTVVNTQSEFEEIFGTPNGEYYTGYTVQNYLRDAGTVTIVRVGNQGGYTELGPQAIISSGSSVDLISTIFQTHNGDGTSNSGSTLTIADSGSVGSEFNITISGSSAISASTNPADGNDIGDVFGSNPRGSKKVYAYNYFENFATENNSTIDSGSTQLITLGDQVFTQDIQEASTPYIKSQLISGERHDLFRFHTLGDGSNYNKEYKIIIFNVKSCWFIKCY